MTDSGTGFEPVAARIENDLTELSAIRDPEAPGLDPRHLQVRLPWLAGLDRRHDAVPPGWTSGATARATFVGVLPGSAPAAPALVTGSHTDTVKGGGRFDGTVGVLGAIEVGASAP